MNKEEIDRVVSIIEDPLKFNVPVWFLNRQKDYVTGKDLQATGTRLAGTLREDLERLKKMRYVLPCYSCVTPPLPAFSLLGLDNLYLPNMLQTLHSAHRGLRHYWGLRVRGQHTKTTGRRGSTVGVAGKKKV